MQFLSNDSGAVTVDWVVLTAALVGLGLATMGVVSSGVEDTSSDIDTQLTSTRICSNFDECAYPDLYDAVQALYEHVEFDTPGTASSTFANFMDALDDTSASGTQDLLESYSELADEEAFRAANHDRYAQWEASDQSIEAYREIYSPGDSIATVTHNLSVQGYQSPQDAVNTNMAWTNYNDEIYAAYGAELTARGAL